MCACEEKVSEIERERNRKIFALDLRLKTSQSRISLGFIT